jgi:hypothetical protein
MKSFYGASRDQWYHFADRLKLRSDLLPVVSDPNAVISPNSKMKDKGKTPSRFNAQDEVSGIPQWTQVNADSKDIARWSRDDRLGICLQTRLVRAFDIDVTTPEIAEQIEQVIRDTVPGVHFPKRWRANSSKCLLAFIFDGELTKRSFPVGADRVELLATGQQFIAIGTHPSGFRYQWTDDLPDAFPVLDVTEVEAIWEALELCFATGATSVAKVSAREHGSAAGGETAASDDVVTYLAEHGLILDEGGTGQVFIDCPWASEHSADNGVTQTAYFPAGTGGFGLGHFKCLHDHCLGRTDDDFLEALGYSDDIEFRSRDFPEIEEPMLPALLGPEPRGPASGMLDKLPFVPPEVAPTLRRDDRGLVKVTQDNVARALEVPEFCTRKLAYDQFADDIVWSWWDEADGAEAWQEYSDVDHARLLRVLDRRNFKATPGIETLRRAVEDVARRRPFDAAIAWINELRWDGTPRVERFFAEYMGAEDTPYTRSVALYMWTALAGRVLVPGIKADMAVIMQTDAQGRGKTSMVEALAPFDTWFGEIDLSRKDEDLARQMRSKVILELAELQGLATRQRESIKKFISARFDEWVPKYKERSIKHLRRCLFIGTTNESEILDDPTGERRWLPLAIRRGDIARIRADRAQLWAEARELFDVSGILWQDAERLARAEVANFKVQDARADKIREWSEAEGLGGIPCERGFTLEELLSQVFDKRVEDVGRADQNVYGKLLRGLGYVKRREPSGLRRVLWMTEENDEC